MGWYIQNMDIRLGFSNLGFVPESVIALGMVYRDASHKKFKDSSTFFISSYTQGEDYHQILKEKAKPLLQWLRKTHPGHKFRQSVDTLPIPEKVLAREAGLGWIGKNTNLIHSKYGSYFFLSTILTDLVIPSTETKETDRCGKCRACIDACPTQAITDEYRIDAGKCISYYTIEDRSETFSDEVRLNGWVYGCDICQEVCPWNRETKKEIVYTSEARFKVRDILWQKKEVLDKLSEEEFQEVIAKSAMDRITFRQWKRNLENTNRKKPDKTS
jgi:epoxyqueuosine reductase